MNALLATGWQGFFLMINSLIEGARIRAEVIRKGLHIASYTGTVTGFCSDGRVKYTDVNDKKRTVSATNCRVIAPPKPAIE